MFDLIGKFLTRSFFYNPIFVVGSGRSGTSILTKSLGQHSQIISIDSEAPFIPYLGYLLFPFEYKDNKEYHVNTLQVSLDYEYELFRRLCFEACFGEHYGLKTITENMRRIINLIDGIRHWCVKTFPNYYECMGLKKLYPNLKLLYIYRNGYDVVNSRSKYRKMGMLSFQENCEIWAKGVEKYKYFFEVEDVMHIRQEDLIADPHLVFKNLFSYIGIDVDNKSSQFAQQTMIHPLNDNTKKDVDVRGIFSQRPPAFSSWTADQKDTFKNICGKGMEILGYEIPF